MTCSHCNHKMKLMQVQHRRPKTAAPTTRRRYACLGGCGHRKTVVESVNVRP